MTLNSPTIQVGLHEEISKLGAAKKSGQENKGHELPKEEEEDKYNDDFSFSRAFHGSNTRKISADDAFYFKPVFPLFNQDHLLTDGDSSNVNKVFVKMPHHPNNLSDPTLTLLNDETVGAYCEWGQKAAEVAPKSSPPTGLSKIWKIKGFMHRRKSAVSTAQENYIRSRLMAEERQKVHLAHHAVGGARGILTRKVSPS